MSTCCLKCGSIYHDSKICTGPVTSFGLIMFSNFFKAGRMYRTGKQCNNHSDLSKYSVHKLQCKIREDTVRTPNIFLVERKDTIAFISIVQGTFAGCKALTELVKELTCNERLNLLHLSFDELWKIAGSARKNKIYCERKFQSVLPQLKILFPIIPCQYNEANYIMPKGRLKYNESTIDCAVREFSEETGYPKKDIQVLYNYPFFVDDFIGSDNKTYRNIFYIATIKENAKLLYKLGQNAAQSKEVGNMGWFTLSESMDLIRDNQKKRILIESCDYICKYRVPAS